VNADSLIYTLTVACFEKRALIMGRSTQPYGNRAKTSVDIHTTTPRVGANIEHSSPVAPTVGTWIREPLERQDGHSKRRREKSNELCEMHFNGLLLTLEKIELI
jgi:hypothetical protein